MILYNVTTKVNADIHQQWLLWMRNDHIPKVMKTGFFVENRLLRILQDEEDEGVTYAAQYLAEDLAAFLEYEKNHAPILREEMKAAFPNQYMSFRTLMEVLDWTTKD